MNVSNSKDAAHPVLDENYQELSVPTAFLPYLVCALKYPFDKVVLSNNLFWKWGNMFPISESEKIYLV